jgi:hypothetical protein
VQGGRLLLPFMRWHPPLTLPPASANDIKCYDGRSTQANATAENKFCVAFSTLCSARAAGGLRNPFCPVSAGAAPLNGTVRARFPIAKLATILSTATGTFVPATPAGFQAALALFTPGTSFTTSAFGPGFPLRKFVNDLVICNTENCNGGDADQCAPAERPVQLNLKFAGIPNTKIATDASGKKTLVPAAVEVLRASIETAVQASACATCSVTLTKVVEDATGNTLYEAPAGAAARRLQAGTSVTTTFATSGGTTAQLAAVSAAASSPAFIDTVTSVVAANPEYSGVTASAVVTPGQIAAALGLLGLLALLVLVPIVYCFCIKKKSASTGKTAPAGVLVVNVPQGSAVIVQQGGPAASGNGAAV